MKESFPLLLCVRKLCTECIMLQKNSDSFVSVLSWSALELIILLYEQLQ